MLVQASERRNRSAHSCAGYAADWERGRRSASTPLSRRGRLVGVELRRRRGRLRSAAAGSARRGAKAKKNRRLASERGSRARKGHGIDQRAEQCSGLLVAVIRSRQGIKSITIWEANFHSLQALAIAETFWTGIAGITPKVIFSSAPLAHISERTTEHTSSTCRARSTRR